MPSTARKATTLRTFLVAMAVAATTWLAAPTASLADLIVTQADPLQGDPLWDWSFSGDGQTGSGTLNTNALSGGSFLITAITGTWDGNSIIGLAPVDTCCIGLPLNDNLLLSGSPQLDAAGFAFDISGDTINIFNLPGFGYSVDDLHTTLATNGSFSGTQTTSVPEPASLALLGTALLGFGAVRRRHKRMS